MQPISYLLNLEIDSCQVFLIPFGFCVFLVCAVHNIGITRLAIGGTVHFVTYAISTHVAYVKVRDVQSLSESD